MNWWVDQTNKKVCCILVALYLLQLCSMFIYFNNDNDKKFQAIPPSEIVTPCFMFFFLGILYSQIFVSSSIHNRQKSYLKPTTTPTTTPQLNLDDKFEEQKLTTTTTVNKDKFDLKEVKEKCDKQIVKRSNISNNINNNLKFNKINKGRLKFKTCSTRTRSATRTSKFDKRKRHLTTDSLTPAQSTLKQEQKLVVANKSDKLLSKRKEELSNNNDEDENVKNLTNQDEEDDLHNLKNLQIKYEQNNYIDDATTSEENDCSPYSSISSNANLKLILNNHTDAVEKENENNNATPIKQNYFEQHTYQPQKTKYYYFKEVVNDEDNRTTSYTYDEDKTNFKRREINERNDDSNDSENGSISPTTPMKSLNDWPMINSENSTEDDEEEEVNLLNVNDVEDDEIEKSMIIPKQDQSAENDLSIEHKRLNSLTNKNLSPDSSKDKISCSIYQEKEWQKINLSMIDICSVIIKKVDTVKYSNEYFYFAIIFSLLFAFMPQFYRLQQTCTNLNNTVFLQSNTVSLSNLVVDKQLMNCDQNELNILDAYGLRKNASDECRILKSEKKKAAAATKSNRSGIFICGAINASNNSEELIDYLNYLPLLVFNLLIDVFKSSVYTFPMKFIVFVALIERFALSLLFFILLCVAERTYREVSSAFKNDFI